MTLEEMVILAREGVKMTHSYFGSEEYLTMKGNLIIFEDGNKIMYDDFFTNKPYFNEGWSKFEL